ncbi:MAG: aspartate aminotransferase [Gammaproteobacteria bacterium SG8_47]|nr:MAG: aspartate aminotransferase [Gammaproteobacteria bacterium SG8_47]
MTSNVFANLAAPGVAALQPYQPGKPVEELERELGIRGAVKLASNENPLGPSPQVLDALPQLLADLGRYPDGNGFALKKVLAARHSVDPSQLTLGNGSNDILELIARAFVTPANEVIFSQHAFAVYPIVTQAVGARAVVTPATNWGHDLDAMARAVNDRTRVVFVANPNNPTGTWLGADSLARFIESLPPHVLVVVDEAYYEYASRWPTAQDDGYPDTTQWLARYPNLIVTRTFSKAYALAGLRVGYAVSNTAVADLLNRVRQPFNVNSLGLAAAVIALQDEAHLERALSVNRDGMKQLIAVFTELGLEYIASAGNFIAVDVGRDAGPVYDALLRRGVIVRPVANYGMPRHLRITVGTDAENARFIEALREVC